tara:strand:- start:191 stop:877 length:687 start_codon:yes stop_codon:yes gene_type:complete
MRSTLYKSQRIGVLVDVQNLYYSARSIYHKKVNFENILKDAVGNRTLIRAIAYVVKTEEFKEKTFFEALERIGYEIKAKDLQIFYGGNKKADWDVGLAMDAIELAAKLDVIVLISGDGDYIPLVQHLKRAFGCKVEGMAFGKTTSSKLREEVDGFTDLDGGARYLRKSIPFRENGSKYGRKEDKKPNQTVSVTSKKSSSESKAQHLPKINKPVKTKVVLKGKTGAKAK